VCEVFFPRTVIDKKKINAKEEKKKYDSKKKEKK
jgi:hypothetical protein